MILIPRNLSNVFHKVNLLLYFYNQRLYFVLSENFLFIRPRIDRLQIRADKEKLEIKADTLDLV